MKKSRRSFLKAAGVTALGIGAAPAITAVASSGSVAAPVKTQKAEAHTAKRWGIAAGQIITRQNHLQQGSHLQGSNT